MKIRITTKATTWASLSILFSAYGCGTHSSGTELSENPVEVQWIGVTNGEAHWIAPYYGYGGTWEENIHNRKDKLFEVKAAFDRRLGLSNVPVESEPFVVGDRWKSGDQACRERCYAPGSCKAVIAWSMNGEVDESLSCDSEVIMPSRMVLCGNASPAAVQAASVVQTLPGGDRPNGQDVLVTKRIRFTNTCASQTLDFTAPPKTAKNAQYEQILGGVVPVGKPMADGLDLNSTGCKVSGGVSIHHEQGQPEPNKEGFQMTFRGHPMNSGETPDGAKGANYVGTTNEAGEVVFEGANCSLWFDISVVYKGKTHVVTNIPSVGGSGTHGIVPVTPW